MVDFINRLNGLRNALAHAFYPENLRGARIYWRGRDVFSIEGFRFFEADAQKAGVTPWIEPSVFRSDLASTHAGPAPSSTPHDPLTSTPSDTPRGEPSLSPTSPLLNSLVLRLPHDHHLWGLIENFPEGRPTTKTHVKGDLDR